MSSMTDISIGVVEKCKGLERICLEHYILIAKIVCDTL